MIASMRSFVSRLSNESEIISPFIVTHRLHIPIKIEPPIQMFIIKNPIVIRLLTGLAFITIETGKKKSRSY